MIQDGAVDLHTTESLRFGNIHIAGGQMASVQELKDALLADQRAAQQATETAISAIGTMLSLASWVVGILAFLIALLALAGVGYIAREARKKSEQIANKYLRDYIKSDAFQKQLAARIDEALDRQSEKILVLKTYEPPEREADDAPPFPDLEKPDVDGT